MSQLEVNLVHMTPSELNARVAIIHLRRLLERICIWDSQSLTIGNQSIHKTLHHFIQTLPLTTEHQIRAQFEFDKDAVLRNTQNSPAAKQKTTKFHKKRCIRALEKTLLPYKTEVEEVVISGMRPRDIFNTLRFLAVTTSDVVNHIGLDNVENEYLFIIAHIYLSYHNDFVNTLRSFIDLSNLKSKQKQRFVDWIKLFAVSITKILEVIIQDYYAGSLNVIGYPPLNAGQCYGIANKAADAILCEELPIFDSRYLRLLEADEAYLDKLSRFQTLNEFVDSLTQEGEQLVNAEDFDKIAVLLQCLVKDKGSSLAC